MKPFGQISIYPTPQSMADKVEEYFQRCFRVVVNKDTGIQSLVEVQPPTMSGLARYLGFSTRSQLLNYKNEQDELYEDVINDAKLRIEDYLEQKLINSKTPAGIIFSLKNNAGWEDAKKKILDTDNNKPLVFSFATHETNVIDCSEAEKELPQGVGGVLPQSTCETEVVTID